MIQSLIFLLLSAGIAQAESVTSQDALRHFLSQSQTLVAESSDGYESMTVKELLTEFVGDQTESGEPQIIKGDHQCEAGRAPQVLTCTLEAKHPSREASLVFRYQWHKNRGILGKVTYFFSPADPI